MFYLRCTNKDIWLITWRVPVVVMMSNATGWFMHESQNDHLDVSLNRWYRVYITLMKGPRFT